MLLFVETEKLQQIDERNTKAERYTLLCMCNKLSSVLSAEDLAVYAPRLLASEYKANDPTHETSIHLATDSNLLDAVKNSISLQLNAQCVTYEWEKVKKKKT